MVTSNGTEDREVKSNSTIPTGPYFSSSADTVIGYIYFFICIVGTVFNFMMLVVIVMKFLKKKFNPTSIIMLQLCVIDLIGCSIQAPVVSYALVKGREFGIENQQAFTVFCDIIGYLSTLLPLLSIYLTSNLCFIRFIGVYYVFSSRRIMTINKALILSFVSWTIPVLISALPFYDNFHFVYYKAVGAFYMLIDYNQYSYPKLIKLFINMSITIPFLVTVVCCSLVVLKLRNNTREQEQFQRTSVTNNEHMTVNERLREHSRSASTSTSRLSVSRENSHDPKRENSRESNSTSAKSASINLLRENSQFWLRKISVTLVPPSPRSMAMSHADELHARPSRQMSQLRDTDSSRRASITITIITLAFIISYGPYMILWLYSLITFELELASPIIDYNHKSWHVYLYVYLVSTTVLSTFNSSIFPLIYFVRIKGRMLGRVWDSIKGRWALLVEKSDNKYHRYFQMELQRNKVRNGKCNGAPSPV
ncbi:alpha-1A adrenergic receptor-like [Bolinopsis microptera]|uniref:alpha-1A adrenergic receptor-like n=1 Tax=Bolinopsis microptera TaxID=2820187 RepID=UPI003079EC5C